MSISINAAFDSGNIRVVGIDGDRVDLEIAQDHQSDFYQWFHFRVAGREGADAHASASSTPAARPIRSAGRATGRASRPTAQTGG